MDVLNNLLVGLDLLNIMKQSVLQLHSNSVGSQSVNYSVSLFVNRLIVSWLISLAVSQVVIESVSW